MKTILALFLAAAAVAQTKIDLGRQGRNVDFASQAFTRPWKAANSVPGGSCSPEGSAFFKLNAALNSNIYVCLGATYQLYSGGTGSPAGSPGDIQYNFSGAFGARSPQGSGAKVQMATGSAGAQYVVAVYDSAGNMVASTNCTADTTGMHCGDGTQSSLIGLPELTASGHGTDFRIYGADSQAASGCIIVSGQPSAQHQVLADSGSSATTTDGKTCPVMTWEAPSGAGGGGAIFAVVTDTPGTGLWQPTTGTSYLPVAGSSAAAAPIATESFTKIAIAKTGTLQHACAVTSGTQAAGGALTMTLRVNGSSSTVVISVPANSPAGTYCDVTHTAVLSGGTSSPDLVNWQVVQAGAASAFIASISLELN